MSLNELNENTSAWKREHCSRTTTDQIAYTVQNNIQK